MIVIDPGHGGEDPGAISGDIVEKDYNLKISKYQYDRFREMGIPVMMTRSTDETLTPKERVNKVLEAFGNKSDVIVLSNHLNAGGGEGAEVVYALRNDDRLANLILTELSKEGQIARRAYQRRLPEDTAKDYYFILRNTGLTTPVLIEYAFVDGPLAEKNQIRDNWENLAEAVVRAVSIYLNIPYEGIIQEDEYIVQKGDNLWSIAKRFNVSVTAIKEANNLTTDLLSIGQRLIIPGLVPPSLEEVTYIVQKGDTLYSIARRYETTTSAIMNLNNLTSSLLSVGQRLKIPSTPPLTKPVEPTPPPPGVYTVKKGDTLFSIAKKFNTTVQNLKDINDLTTDVLSINQVLVLPESAVTPIIEPEVITYTVKKGDNLYDISRKHGTTVTAIMNLNNLTSTLLSIGQVLKIPTATMPSPTLTYTVKKGDNLYDISRKHGTTVTAIMNLNNLTSTLLSIGQVLKIPVTSSSRSNVVPLSLMDEYVVEKGDTLYELAKRYQTTVTELKTINNLKTDLLMVGQILTVPPLIETEEKNNSDRPLIINYIVERDDDLSSIAEQFKVSPQIIINVNNLKTSVLKIGQTLLIPIITKKEELEIEPTVFLYKVIAGDTLWSIARKFGTTVTILKELNELKSNLIVINQLLLVPVVHSSEIPLQTTLYIVKKNDTLRDLGQKFDVNVKDLKEINNLKNDSLKIGQILFIPQKN
jgi:LysM repeat protein